MLGLIHTGSRDDPLKMSPPGDEKGTYEVEENGF